MSLCDAPRSFLGLETLVETGHGVSEGIEFIYSEKAIKFCEISTLLLPYVVPVKSKVDNLQNFVAFSEHISFNKDIAIWTFNFIFLHFIFVTFQLFRSIRIPLSKTASFE